MTALTRTDRRGQTRTALTPRRAVSARLAGGLALKTVLIEDRVWRGLHPAPPTRVAAPLRDRAGRVRSARRNRAAGPTDRSTSAPRRPGTALATEGVSAGSGHGRQSTPPRRHVRREGACRFAAHTRTGAGPPARTRSITRRACSQGAYEPSGTDNTDPQSRVQCPN